MLLVLLRIAIGWHFLTEGLDKRESGEHGKPFSAEIYLRNANGPFAPYFRGMLPDPNGLNMLEPDRLKKSWADMAEDVGKFYGFDEDQKGKVKQLLADADVWADYWFANPDNVKNRDKYYHDLGQAMKVERDPNAMSFEKERAYEARKTLDGDRKTLTAPIVTQTEALKGAILGLATPDQKKAKEEAFHLLGYGPEYRGPITGLDVANVMTTYGLILMGGCLILGLFTPFAALCATAFLTMIYLSMPPWPGLPDNPKVEGHYWIVSKNLIELIACLMIAFTPSAHWVGLDALLFGARRRRPQARRDRQDGDDDRNDDDIPGDGLARKAETVRISS